MSEDLRPACAELAALIPALVPALSRDGTPPDGRTALSAGSAVNPDVLHAMTVLAPGTRACSVGCLCAPLAGRAPGRHQGVQGLVQGAGRR